MDIQLKNLQKKARINLPKLQKITARILKLLKIRKAVISVVFVSRQKIQSLNKQFLNRSYATDVLAFDLRRDKSLRLEGDIIISVDAARENAKEFGNNFEEELVLYITHGILHLIGYDDHKFADIESMRAMEQKVLTQLRKS
jgi:probable rRNA maturation factor